MTDGLLCVARPDGMGVFHCWHDTGTARLTDPPQLEQRCCHCGMMRTEPTSMRNLYGHGPYRPGRRQE